MTASLYVITNDSRIWLDVILKSKIIMESTETKLSIDISQTPENIFLVQQYAAATPLPSTHFVRLSLPFDHLCNTTKTRISSFLPIISGYLLQQLWSNYKLRGMEKN